ncbi:MAG TPA: ABC transporter ATP-binding protein [Devosiaceae bacterium]|jgi:iron(III) transport system ATP-binding protein
MDMRYSQTDAAPDAAVSNAVEISALTKIFGTRSVAKPKGAIAAVDDVTITVPKGKLLVLLGPSGCGKTTLLRCVAGLERPTEGQLRIGGKTVYDSAAAVFVEPENRGLGMMFQSYALWPHMTVFQNIAYVLTSERGQSREEVRGRIEKLLADLGVHGLGERYPGELSGGQQQRVALARALVRKPTVLLFDEPLSNVDARVRRRLRAELRSLKEQTNFAGIYVTHDQEEAMELADILAVMENGKIIQAGSPRAIYDNPRSMYVADFIGEINRFAGTVSRREGGYAIIETAIGEFRIASAAAQPGDSGWVAIRPEDMRLTPPMDGASSQHVAAIVRECVFLGARTELRLRVGDEEAHLFVADRAFAQPSPGSSIDIYLPDGSVKWLTR